MLASILRWLRAGYPEGVPGPDRVPLLALLRATSLTDDQVKEVVRNFTDGHAEPRAGDTITGDEIAEFISGVTHHDATTSDIERVAARLAAAGWPTAGITEADS